MDTQTLFRLEFFESATGDCSVKSFLENIPVKQSIWIYRKNEYYGGYKIYQLLQQKRLEKVQGDDNTKEIYELKYDSSPPYRMLCIIRSPLVIGLEMFQGSGSKGNVRKYLKKAVTRAEEHDNKNDVDKQR